MLNSPLVRSVTLALFGLVLCTGCARNLKKGSGSSGDIYDGAGGGNDTTGLYDGSLPARDESTNPENAEYGTLAPYTVYFAFDSFTIDPPERTKLEKTAEYLKQNAGAKVILAGHTDARGTTQYNLGLGERRAIATREYLIGLGVPAGRLTTISYGEERPTDSGEGEAAYAKNRRVQAGLLK